MDLFLNCYGNQKMFSIPDRIQDSLKEKIQNADFLITDAKGDHRLIGVKFVPEKMDVPVITCVCMRHEMPAAKQIVFNTGKKIYYSSEASARLFKYYTNESLNIEDFDVLIPLYADYYIRNKIRL